MDGLVVKQSLYILYVVQSTLNKTFSLQDQSTIIPSKGECKDMVKTSFKSTFPTKSSPLRCETAIPFSLSTLILSIRSNRNRFDEIKISIFTQVLEM